MFLAVTQVVQCEEKTVFSLNKYTGPGLWVWPRSENLMFWGSSLHSSCADLKSCSGLEDWNTLHKVPAHSKTPMRPIQLQCYCFSDWIQGFTCHLCLNFLVSLHRSYKLKIHLPDFNTNKLNFYMYLLSIQKKNRLSNQGHVHLCIQSTKLSVFSSYLKFCDKDAFLIPHIASSSLILFFFV